MATDRWAVAPTYLTIWDDDGHPSSVRRYAAADLLCDQAAAAALPAFEDERDARQLVNAMNALGWDANDYFDRGAAVNDAIARGELDRFVGQRLEQPAGTNWMQRFAALVAA